MSSIDREEVCMYIRYYILLCYAFPACAIHNLL
jgi:hypothetical protein